LELEVFKKSHGFVLEIYKLTDEFPKDERFRIVDQIIRASYSIPANIIEGQNRNTTKEYISFLHNARGSAYEVKYFLLLSKDLNFIDIEKYDKLNNNIVIIIKMLNSLIRSLKEKI